MVYNIFIYMKHAREECRGAEGGGFGGPLVFDLDIKYIIYDMIYVIYVLCAMCIIICTLHT